MSTVIRNAALALAVTGLALPATASAAEYAWPGASHSAYPNDTWEHNRDRGKHRGWYKDRGHSRDYDRYRSSGYRSYGYYQPARTYYAEPVYRDTRVWRGNDGRYYCSRRDGTTGLIVGAAAGALLGRSVDSRGDRTLGTILGAAAGAVIGKEIDKGGCR
ncbi:glycine zipper 2TM domain-containing protein [Altererythrobacter salegens]|uniref:17 kDa surface antigen n=1 Tax=Croceibacterium salegens TaxID=1737568 RepID=A0A6I4SVL5_9SPHN|nr:glycine zipper 2TM domain-containing protein [Croceibacterium salegens]MXO58342.1 glycine zipper 2TM domain-containing protein [Croceibacterium salegens]